MTDHSNLADFLASSRAIVDRELDALVPPADREPQNLHQAMRWSLFAGGKRFRPALALAVGETFGAPHVKLLRAACALEMIHTYSLIHDDLPAMDDDDLRRGVPTCHIKFGEATAILAGDALQTLAFLVLAEDYQLSNEIRVRLIQELARAAGTPQGMIAGQTFDLLGEKQNVTQSALEKIHSYKTGAMIVAATRIGAVVAGAGADEMSAIAAYGSQLGLLFQITDDLLDVTATAADLGKTPGKDAQAEKATYPKVYGFDRSQKLAAEIHQNCLCSLDKIGRPTRLLGEIADFILNRKA